MFHPIENKIYYQEKSRYVCKDLVAIVFDQLSREYLCKYLFVSYQLEQLTKKEEGFPWLQRDDITRDFIHNL